MIRDEAITKLTGEAPTGGADPSTLPVEGHTPAFRAPFLHAND